MAWRTPPSLAQFCRQVLPLLAEETEGRRLQQVVADIVETDQWNSFDRFHDTTRTLVRHYEEAGALAEVHPLQTGGRLGSGRWVIHEAVDVRAATVDVVQPVRQRVLDFRDNPWHVIQWSGSTPGKGVRSELAIVDSPEELERMPASGLAGRMVLTRMNPEACLHQLASRGVAGVIIDHPVADLPGATAWLKFGWGGIPLADAAVHLVGLVLSENEGKKLRRLAQKHGRLILHTRVDIRRYTGTHDVVSGLVRGRDDPQDEVWVLAHGAEPGALDNASGVAVCVEVARVLEGLIAAGQLPRPRRTIRLLSGYECYGFFKYLEEVGRLQPPLAGVVVDAVGARPELCDGRLEWHATIPMSAGFVDRVGAAILRATLKLDNPGYRLFQEPFMSTADTLIGDPRYGFPAPWLSNYRRRKQRPYAAYHNSADTVKVVSPRGLAACTVAVAGYLYYLADAGSREAVELAIAESRHTLAQLEQKKGLSAARAEYLGEAHRVDIQRLKRWLWGGYREAIMHHLDGCEGLVQEAAAKVGRGKRVRPRRVAGADRVPRRRALLVPDWGTNTTAELAARMRETGLQPWALFWADGKRNLREIAQALSCEYGREVQVEKVLAFFEAHVELGYAELIDPGDMVSKGQLVADFKKLGLQSGMDVMVHSSLSKIGHVRGGADTVIDALLAVIGRRGTLMMPSFNHQGAQVYNPLATPTTNGAIPDTLWRRSEAMRSLQGTHAVAAIGPRAEAYCQGHLEAGLWAQDSPIGKLVHGGGYILSLGVSQEASTAYHVAEESMPCTCIDPFGNIDRVVLEDGRVYQVQGLAWRAGMCPVSPARLDETLDRRRLQQRGKVGQADATLVKGLDLWKVRRAHLKNACPTCTIKPLILERP